MRTCQEYEALISAFIDGALEEGDRAALMEHMAGCPACQAYFDDQIAIHDALEALEAEAPEGFAEQVMARVRTTAQEKPEETAKDEKKVVSFPRWRRWAALAACCAVAALGVWSLGRQGEETAEDCAAVTQYAAADDAALEPPVSQPEGQTADSAAPMDTNTAAAEDAAPSTKQTEEEVEAVMTMDPAYSDSEAAVYRLEREETVLLTIDRWQDEGFTATVAAGDGGGVFQAGDTVLAVFEEGTEVLLSDGSEFSYDGEAPNAPDCGLEAGETVEVSFAGYELEPALRIYAVRVKAEN